MTSACKRLLGIALVAFIYALGQGAEDAKAGTYNVTQCHTGTGAGLSPQWSTQLNGSWKAENLCTSGMQVAGYGLDGVYAMWTLHLPAGLTVNSVNFWSNGLGAPQTAVFATLCAADAIPVCSWGSGGYTDLNQSSAKHVMTTPGSTMFRMQLGSTGYVHYTSSAYASIWNLDFTLNDGVSPSLGTPTGNLVVGGWNRGNLTGGVGATDGQSGIKTLLATVDANPVGPASVSNALACSNLNIVPCPTSTSGWTPTISTTALADGPHKLVYSAADFSGNSSASPEATFKVDNTAPAVPYDVHLPGTGGWSAVNDIDVSWSNSGEEAETETQSGIGAVKVDVDPGEIGQTDPAAFTIPVDASVNGISATTDSLSGLTVPAPGKWKLKLSTVDRAGNESPVGDGGNGAADGVFNIGFDPNPPAKPQGQSNGWISRDELAAGFVAEWSQTVPRGASPICGYAESISSTPADPGSTISLPSATTSMSVPSNLAEGMHFLNLRAVNCAGVSASSVENIQIPVDLTDPLASILNVASDQWYNGDVTFGLAGIDSLSGMTGQADPTAPYQTGAYLTFEVDGQPKENARGSSKTVLIHAEGSHALWLTATDLAGNRSKPTSITFGIDKTSPSGAFDMPDPSTPTHLVASVTDSLSGLSSGTIEVRREGSDEWHTLTTSIGDSAGNAVGGFPNSVRVSARFPDTILPKGTYRVRLRARDRADNLLTTSRRTDGSEMTISNPLRGGVTLSAGLSKANRSCRTRSHRRCLRRRRGKVVFTNARETLTVGFKRGAVVQGVLTDEKLRGLARQPIEIYIKAGNGPELRAGETSTRADGSYVFKLKPGMSRKVRVYFPGSELVADTSATASLATQARIAMRTSTRHARSGQKVFFSGSVRSFDGTMPAGGKLVVLQFKAGRRWLPAVAVAHTNRRGKFKVGYRFSGKRVRNRIVFRVYAPTEDGWGHSASASRSVTMALN
ncbi:MAG: Ig-like domain repeat protein [Solirubrobacterales bacterium]